MKVAFVFIALCASCAVAEDVTPVQKVVELLNGMLAKGKKMMKDEQVQYAAFEQFCGDTQAEKKQAISDAEDLIGKLNADIEMYVADAAQLTKEIAEHESDITTWNGEMEVATAQRKKEKTDYDALYADYSESISALERAIEVLKKETHTRSQAALVQMKALKDMSFIPIHAKKALDAFLQESDLSSTGVVAAAPEAAGYEFQSQGIIDMLDKLLDKFVGERTAAEKKEMNQKHAYDMTMQDMQAQVDQASQDRTEKIGSKAQKLELKAQAESDVAETTKIMESDEKFLADLTATCAQKKSDFAARQDLRSEEIEAIEKAVEIISSGAVAGNADKHLPTMVQVKTKGSVLAQLRAHANTDEDPHRVVSYLRSQAVELKSRLLMQVADRAEKDPFRKVKKMIKDLIVKLMEEANEEAEHKAWCDTELTTNAQTRKEKTSAVETLTAEKDELEADITKLTEQLAELAKQMAELKEAQAKATKLRTEEKAKNQETIADAKQAETAVAQALVVLKEFYNKAGESTAFTQQQPELPPIFDRPYQGMQSENGGVVGMLEVIESDFSRLGSETKAAEEAAQKEYDEFMTESAENMSEMDTDSKHKTAKKQDKEESLVSKKSDLDNTQKELDAALAYYDKLKPSCVDAGVSFDDRVGRRKEEIQSLQEALKILNGEDLA